MTPYWTSDDGRHVLYNADCLDVLPTLAPGSAVMVFTDPPYGHNNNNGDLIHKREAALGKGPHGEPRAIANDGAEANDVYRAALPLIRQVLSPGGCCCCCCCGGGGPDPQFARWALWLDEVMDFKQMVVWDKGPMGMGWHYRRSYEVVLVAQKPGAACRWYDTTHRVENIIRPSSGIAKIIPTKDEHPTLKPVSLASHFINLHSQEGDTILDPFTGSGTTGVACIRTGRRFVGVELSREYCDIAVRRMETELAQPFLPGLDPAQRETTQDLFAETIP